MRPAFLLFCALSVAGCQGWYPGHSSNPGNPGNSPYAGEPGSVFDSSGPRRVVPPEPSYAPPAITPLPPQSPATTRIQPTPR